MSSEATMTTKEVVRIAATMERKALERDFNSLPFDSRVLAVMDLMVEEGLATKKVREDGQEGYMVTERGREFQTIMASIKASVVPDAVGRA